MQCVQWVGQGHLCCVAVYAACVCSLCAVCAVCVAYGQRINAIYNVACTVCVQNGQCVYAVYVRYVQCVLVVSINIVPNGGEPKQGY